MGRCWSESFKRSQVAQRSLLVAGLPMWNKQRSKCEENMPSLPSGEASRGFYRNSTRPPTVATGYARNAIRD
jgi:hypothetical protein